MKDQNQNNFLGPVGETEVPELPRQEVWRIYSSQRPAFSLIYRAGTLQDVKSGYRTLIKCCG